MILDNSLVNHPNDLKVKKTAAINTTKNKIYFIILVSEFDCGLGAGGPYIPLYIYNIDKNIT